MAIGDGIQQAYKSALGIAEETTWGSIATATGFVEFTSESMNGEIEARRLDEINSQRTPFKRLQGNKSVSGGFEAPLDPAVDAIVLCVKQLMGGTVTSTQIGATTGYQHVFFTGDMESNAATTTATDVKGLTAQIRKGGDHVFEFYGMRVNQMTISGEVGEPVRVSFEMIGRDFTQTSALSTTVAYSTTLPFNFTGIAIQNGDSIGNVTATETFMSFELTVNNNLVNDVRQLGSRILSQLPVATQDVNLTLGQRFDTTTAYGRWNQETVRAYTVVLDTGNTIGAAGSSTYSMLIQLPRAYHDASTIPQIGSRDDVLQQELGLSCLHDDSAGYAVRFQINNATTNYE